MTAKQRIPFYDYPTSFQRDEDGYLGVLREVMRRGAFILQKDLSEFEAALTRYLGVRHAFGVADGTNAMILGLKAAGIGPGDEVILPSHTYIATAAAVHLVGATPVLADIGPDRLIDPGSAETKITLKTKAIMPVQLNGRTCDMDAIRILAAEYGLKLFEDSAQALGSKFRDQCAGTFGVFGTYSFFPAKVLGCFGDGGAIVTNDDEVAQRIALLRDHGRDENGRVVDWGTNCRLDNIQAAILNYKLDSYGEEIARRREIAAAYQAALGGIEDLRLPAAPDADPDHFDIYQNYELEAGRRDELRAHLDADGIGTLIQWGGTPVHQFRELGFAERLPETERFFERCFMLPMNTTLTDEQVQRICGSVRAFYGLERAVAA